MDQLHLDLWWRGLNVAADSGTYLYNALPPWDNPLVSSLVHNCVTIDGREQMTRASRFLVLDWFPAYSRHTLSVAPPVLAQLTAHHRGYDRLGLRHVRTLSLLDGGRWRVKDDLLFFRPRTHTIRLHWLLHDGEWHLQQHGSEIRLRLRVPGGWIRILVTASGFGTAVPEVTLVRAGRVLHGDALAQPFEGWISTSYGRKVPALSLAWEGVASNTCSLTTEFILPS
jgi:hypothetical protein